MSDTSRNSHLASGTPVNNPKHYNSHPSGVECITIVRHMDFNTGAAMKYIWRHGFKEATNPAKAIEDLEKARWHLADEIALLRKVHNMPEPAVTKGSSRPPEYDLDRPAESLSGEVSKLPAARIAPDNSIPSQFKDIK